MLEPSPDAFAAHPASEWTGPVKVRFLDCLAQNGNVRAACARVGLSAETAYRQRRRDPVFARAWAAATALARHAVERVLADHALEGIEEEVWFRGELVGTRRRFDSRLLLALLGRLDRQVEETAGERDAGCFDALLAILAGVEMPVELADNDGLPMSREKFVEETVQEARAAVRDSAPQEDWRDFGKTYSPEELDARERADEALQLACDEEALAAEADAHQLLDEWLAEAHAAVDAALAAPEKADAATRADISSRTLSTVSTPPVAS